MTRQEILKVAKPILFNTEMVRAIQDGRKTVTRRIVKNNPCECESKQINGVCKICDDKGGFYLPDEYITARSPYKIGDYLYVRETWATNKSNACIAIESGICPHEFCDTADGTCFADEYIYKADDLSNTDVKWRPSIHMPKEAARIFLLVTDVRAERLQAIDHEDAEQEGCWCDIGEFAMPIDKFANIWDKTLKKSDIDLYGWDANPWVWVIEFERVEVEP